MKKRVLIKVVRDGMVEATGPADEMLALAALVRVTRVIVVINGNTACVAWGI